MLALEIQRRLIALGYGLGASGPAKDGVDGVLGEVSQQAILSALETGKPAPAKPVTPPEPPAPSIVGSTVPMNWTPAATMRRIIVHWTAGGYSPTEFDRGHYHILIKGDGTLVRGIPSIALNDAGGVKPGYAAHTLGCNTGSIGVSLACMAGAIESPANNGPAPLTRAQWDELPRVLADLCARYGIKVTPTTVLSHAEVQANLGITQRGKWDIARLPFDVTLNTPKKVGDAFRARTAARLGGGK